MASKLKTKNPSKVVASDEISSKESALAGVIKLVAKYMELKELGGLAQYNEAQTRNEFIEPMFEFLGWDMRNLRNTREVITEESVSSGRVDLSFQIIRLLGILFCNLLC